jgi:hypothetical protein
MGQHDRIADDTGGVRWKFSAEAWHDFIVKMPFPTLERSDVSSEVTKVLNTLVRMLFMAAEENGLLMISVTPPLLPLTALDPSAVVGVIHVVLIARQFTGDLVPLVPWLGCLAYWISRARSLPTVAKGSGEWNVMSLLSVPVAGVFGDMVRRTDELVSSCLSLESAVSPAFPPEVSEDLRTIGFLSLLSAWTIFGFRLGYNTFVGRESLCEVLLVLPVFSELVGALSQFERAHSSLTT